MKKMEVSMSSVAVAIVVVTLVTWVLNFVWLRPKRLERFLRRQGLRGNSYKLLHGDLKESFSIRKETYSRPISLCDDIVPRILPYENHIIHKYGKDCFAWLGPSPMVMIMDPEHIKEVLVKFGDFRKPQIKHIGQEPGKAITDLEGEEWAMRRKIINPAFNAEKLKLMLPAFYLSCSEMINKWQNLVADEGSCELDVWPCFQNLARDVISRTAFGSSYEEGRDLFQLQREAAKILSEVVRSPYIPGLRFMPTKINKKRKEINNKIQSVLMHIIRKKEKAIKMGESGNNDLLGILLESNMNEIRDNGNKKNVGMSIADVIEECKIFYFAGQETTSSLLVWTMLLLSQHPTWQDRAREEVLQVFGDNTPDYKGLNCLKIVTMILNEVLRLYPPSSMLGRSVHKETKLGNLTLPAGSCIALPILLVHHDKTIWGEDVKEFNPERFSKGISVATNNTLSFFPFGWGPRICTGQNFAMIEAKLALAMILRTFWFELSPSYIHAPFPAITVQPQHGCHVILHKR